MDEGPPDEWRRVLPPGLTLQEGTPPARPISFGDDYSLPEHCVKPLQLLRSTTEKDRGLSFYEKPHVYTLQNVPLSASVTALAHTFERPFQPAVAISGMKTSRSQAWPRLEYVHDSREGSAKESLQELAHGRGILGVCDGRTVASIQPWSTDPDKLNSVERLWGLLRACSPKNCEWDQEDVVLYTFSRCLSDAEIEGRWKEKGVLASHEGTEAHYQAELLFNGLPCRWWEPEMRGVWAFVRQMVERGLIAHSTEREIVCADADVAGSIDLIVFDPANNLYHIVDFKRSDKLQRDLRGFGKMKSPFNHLDDCKGCGYALQTSIYQYILERDYDMRIGERILLSVHPDAPFTTSVPFLKAEVDFIMRSRIDLTAARRRVRDQNQSFACSITGAPAVDAVRLEGGAVAMEKAALVAGRAFAVDGVTRCEFEAAVAKERGRVEFDRSRCVPWRKLMPEQGLSVF